MTRTWIAAALALAVAAACGKKAEKAEPAKDETETSASETREGNPSPKQRIAQKRPPNPVTVEEATPLFAVPEGARQIKAPAQAGNGTRVEAQWCLDDGELEALGQSVSKSLTDGGWTGVNMRANPRVADRMNVSARKEPFVLTGFLQKGSIVDCDGGKGQTLLTMNVHKQSPRPAGLMPVGPRQPQLMRPSIGGQGGIQLPVRPAPVQPSPGTGAPPAAPPAPPAQ
jgi:hypothetical protein